MRRWSAALAVYFEPRVLAILLLGFSAGVPLALTGQTLAVWMTESGVSLTSIGIFSLVGLPYVLKFLWAPAIDAVAIPWATRRFGRRRSWLLATQVVLVGATISLGLVDPRGAPWATAALALLVAFASASQDIVVDAFRVESLAADRQAAGMANYVAGYRVALLVSTAGAFELASAFQAGVFTGNAGWALTYAVMAGLILVGVLATLCSAEPADPGAATRAALPLAQRFDAAVVAPFREFAGRHDWLAILLFIMLFKLPDAMAGVMTAPFVLDLGFSKTDYGRVVKVFGFAATLAGGFAGGFAARALSPIPALWIAGLAQAASNLMFVWLAGMGPVLGALIATNAVENFTGGFGTVIFVAYLSGLCTNRSYTATQYALLSALAAVARIFIGTPSGWLAQNYGWPPFFIVTTLTALPGFLLLWWLTRPSARAA